MRENFRHLFFLVGAICVVSLALHPLSHIEDEFSLAEDHESECQLCSSLEDGADQQSSNQAVSKWQLSPNFNSARSALSSLLTIFEARAPPF